MRKMRPNFQFKPRLVASGAYDTKNNRYVLDNKLEPNKMYLLTISDGDNGGQTFTTLILSTFNTSSYPSYSFNTPIYNECWITLERRNYNYLIENTNNVHYSSSGYLIFVYELFGVSGV